MACHLRAHGDQFNVEAFVMQTSLDVCDVFHKGQPRNRASKVLCEFSGLTVTVSDADFNEFEKQLADANEFMSENAFEIRRLAAFDGVDVVFLDFGTGWIKGAGAQFWRFPTGFVQALADLNLGLELSHYPV